MNLVESVMEQLSPEILGKLSKGFGESEATTTKAVTAGVPSLLAILAKLASNPETLAKLTAVLKNFDLGSLAKILEALKGGNSGPATQAGTDILGSLLGGGNLGKIISALAKYSGVGAELAKKVLGMIVPLVLGAIVNHFKNQPVTSQGLADLFTEQKSNITKALPSGLSLADLDGVKAGASALTKVLVGLAALALIGAGIWYYTRPTFPVPEVDTPPVEGGPPGPKIVVRDAAIEAASEGTKFAGDLTKLYTGATETLAGIKDAATADAAEPKLKEMVTSADALKLIWDKLPDAAKAMVKEIQAKNLEPLKMLVAKLEALPVVGEKLKPILDDLVAKFSAFGE